MLKPGMPSLLLSADIWGRERERWWGCVSMGFAKPSTKLKCFAWLYCLFAPNQQIPISAFCCWFTSLWGQQCRAAARACPPHLEDYPWAFIPWLRALNSPVLEAGQGSIPPCPIRQGESPSPRGCVQSVFAQAEMILCFLLSLLNCPVGESLSALHFVAQNWCWHAALLDEWG